MGNPKINKSKLIYNISGEYYAGMTKKEAETNGIYKKMFGLDFKDIDQDKNDILSPHEILNAREKEYSRKNFSSGACQMIGFALMGVGSSMEIPTAGVSTSIFLAGAAICGYGTYESQKLEKEAKITEQYKKQLKN